MFESIFGPEGYFREDTVHEFLKHVLRSKRDVGSSVDTFAEAIRDTDPRGSLYLRFFGKDIRYASFDGLPAITSFFDNPMSILNLARMNRVIEYEKSTMFLDGAIITSTAAGLPLNLTVQGASSVKVQSDININLVELFKSGKAELEVDLKPSATVEITCSMGVDAVVTRSEIKSTTKLHTATDIGGKLNVDGKKLVKAQMKIPREKLEIFESSIDYLIFNEGNYDPVVSYQKEEDLNYCTPEYISDTFGMETCGHVGFFHGRASDDPTWLWSGHANMKISLTKTDSFQDMIVKYAWTTDTSNPRKGTMNDIYVIYDTPGSSVVRKTIFEVKFDEYGKFVDVDLIIPALDIKAQIKYDWIPEKKNIDASLIVDRSEIIRMTTSISKYPNKFEGIARLIYLNKKIVDWTGNLHSIPASGRYSLAASLDGSLHPKVNLTGDLTRKGDKFEAQGSLASTFVDLKFSSNSRLTDTTYKLKGSANYSFLGGPKHLVDVVTRSSKLTQGVLTTRNLHLDINVSCNYKNSKRESL